MKAKNVNLSSITSIARNSKRVWDRVHLTYRILIILERIQSNSTDGSHRHLINLMKNHCNETINTAKFNIYSSTEEGDIAVYFRIQFFLYVVNVKMFGNKNINMVYKEGVIC
jgi:hypothetical protein